MLTTAVGPNVLRFIAPHVLQALRDRSPDAAPLAVMACENAIDATSMLRAEIERLAGPDEWIALERRAVFANTAVDRIVPGSPGAGLDVTVETFSSGRSSARRSATPPRSRARTSSTAWGRTSSASCSR